MQKTPTYKRRTLRQQWSSDFAKNKLHPRDERRLRLDMGNVLTGNLQELKTALMEAGYSKKAAEHFGPKIIAPNRQSQGPYFITMFGSLSADQIKSIKEAMAKHPPIFLTGPEVTFFGRKPNEPWQSALEQIDHSQKRDCASAAFGGTEREAVREQAI